MNLTSCVYFVLLLLQSTAENKIYPWAIQALHRYNYDIYTDAASVLHTNRVDILQIFMNYLINITLKKFEYYVPIIKNSY